MHIEIITTALTLDITGLGAVAADKDYTATAFALSGRMWEIIKANVIKNKGHNIWVYESGNRIFTGVEPEDALKDYPGLENKKIVLEKYAAYKHTGPYQLIPKAGQEMRNHLAMEGFKTTLPYIEIYGHWVPDESKLQTTLLMCIE